MKDRNYKGNPCLIRGVFYGKCLMLCPEPSPDGTHGEVIYKLPAVPAKPVLCADIGIEDAGGFNGSATFMVQVSDSPQGKWETLYNSAVLRGGADPIIIKVLLGQAKYLRLYTTDAGDGINSDCAVWGNVRLKPGE